MVAGWTWVGVAPAKQGVKALFDALRSQILPGLLDLRTVFAISAAPLYYLFHVTAQFL